MQESIQDWLELDERNPGFQFLTEDSAMEEESDNELDELQESVPFICFLSFLGSFFAS
jgi:hypothetical protein